MRGWWFMSWVLTGSLAAAVSATTPTWDQALQILDLRGPDAAAAYLQPGRRQDPGRLDLLDAWLRLEQRRCPADSVAGSVLANAPDARPIQAWLDDPTTSIAAPDSVTAAIVALRAWRAAAAGPRRPTLAAARRRFADLLSAAEPPPRLAAEVNLLLADLAYLADDLAVTDSLLAPIVAAATFPSVTARAHNTLGGVAAKQRCLDQAELHYREAERLARRVGDPELLATVLKNLGYQVTMRRDLAAASAYLAEADTLARRWHLLRLQGAIRAGQGAVAEMAGHRTQAVGHFREAAELSAAQHDVMSEVGARQRLAYSLSLLGDYPEARAEYRTCLRLLDEHHSEFIRNWVLAGLALMEHKLGRLDLAAASYAEARELDLAMGDHLSAAWCLNSLGLIQTLRGRYREALLTDHEALRQFELAGDLEGMGEAHASLSEAYLELGDLGRAREHGQHAFVMADSTSSQELLLRSLQDLAAAHPGAAPAAETADLYKRAIAIAAQWGDRLVEARLWLDLAAHHLASADTAAARGALARSAACLPDGPHHQVRARAALLEGRLATSHADAIGRAERAVAEAEAAGLPGLEWEAHSDLGWYQHLAGHRERGLSHQEHAAALVEGLRWQVGADELRRHILRTANLPFERLVSQLMAAPARPAEALAASERSRAQILAGRLRTSLVQAPDTTRSRAEDLAASIAFLQSRLQDGSLPAGERDSLRRRVRDVEQAASLQRLQTADGMAAVALPPIVTLRRALAADERVLSYVLGDQESFLFVVSADSVRACRLPARAVLEAKVQRFLDLQRAVAMPAEVMAAARAELFRLLVAPAMDQVPPDARLFIVPDGLLHRLPFVFLGEGELLVVRHQLCLVPSLQTLTYLRQRAARRPAAGDAVLAVGSRGGEPGRRHPFRDEPMPPLEAAEDEARAIADLVAHTTVLVGDLATETVVRERLGTARLIHVAAHSDLDLDDVRRTHLVLNRSADADDGLLMWPEIASLNLQADLVTLASCRSADGVLVRGEGIGGLAQAFLHAGARCVLGSTIDLSDRDARRLMRRFYHHLAGGLPASAALREVQLSLLVPGTDPRLRAAGEGLVLVGDGAVVVAGLEPRRRAALPFSIVGMAVIICVILAWRRSKR
ncbi:MAG: CHAT domain-containing tetratricopeptide repeat protein [Candidatus Krumholzibacteriia bacterium]